MFVGPITRNLTESDGPSLQGRRVLFLSSDVPLPEEFRVDVPLAELDQIEFPWLQKLAQNKDEIDVVMVRIPKSRRLAQAFVQMGFKHVICFDMQLEVFSLIVQVFWEEFYA